MGRFALALAFLFSGMYPLSEYIYRLGVIDNLPYLDRIFCLPALFLGLGSWLRTRTFARSWSLLSCLAVLLLGVFLADATETGRGLLVFAGVATAFPIAALIVELKATQLCALVFMASALFNVAFIVVFLGGIGGQDNRFGYLVWQDVRLSDPNDLAVQLGISAVLTISFMQYLGKQSSKFSRHTGESSIWLTMLLGTFCAGILLTASRSGILSLAIIMVFFAFSRRTKLAHRIALCLCLFLATLLTFTTDNEISRRFYKSQNTLALGNRLPIWQSGLSILGSDSHYLKFGVGTGAVEKALAETGAFHDSLRYYEDGIYRKFSHNSYVEWILAHGLLGIPLALWLLYRIYVRARKLDSIDRSNDRKLLLAYGAIISMTTVVYRLPFATPLCALLFAMLSGPFLAPWPVSKRVPNKATRLTTTTRPLFIYRRTANLSLNHGRSL